MRLWFERALRSASRSIRAGRDCHNQEYLWPSQEPQARERAEASNSYCNLGPSKSGVFGFSDFGFYFARARAGAPRRRERRTRRYGVLCVQRRFSHPRRRDYTHLSTNVRCAHCPGPRPARHFVQRSVRGSHNGDLSNHVRGGRAPPQMYTGGRERGPSHSALSAAAIRPLPAQPRRVSSLLSAALISSCSSGVSSWS